MVESVVGLTRRNNILETSDSSSSFMSAKSKAIEKLRDRKMNRLNFEEVQDDIAHPLSSLRSCSEYMKFRKDSEKLGEPLETSAEPSLLSQFISWFVKEKDIKEGATKYVEEENKRRSRIFSGALSVSPNAKNIVSFTRALTLVPSEERRCSLDSSSSIFPLFSNSEVTPQESSCIITQSTALTSEQRRLSILSETTDLLDILFGYRADSIVESAPAPHIVSKKGPPMEIELTDLTVSRNSSLNRSVSSTHTRLNTLVPFRPLYSQPIYAAPEPEVLETQATSTAVSSEPSQPELISTRAAPAEDPIPIDQTSQSFVYSVIESGSRSAEHAPTLFFEWIESFIKVRHFVIDQSFDESFYEAVRIQPFASGSYLRGMLLGGLCSMAFNIFTIIYWPVSSAPLTRGESVAEVCVYLWLLAILLIQFAQLPLRLHIHLRCFASSRAIEVDNAVATLRQLFISDAWLLNRALGWIGDGLCFGGTVLAELYLWFVYFASNSTPGLPHIQEIIYSVTTTIVLALCMRIFVTLLFCFSMHDPLVLAEARRRGLSKWDLEILPTFVYSRPDEVSNPDGCSICLSNFCLGEMLISLPCDKRHSFHANCIRQWLHRQNSCPLCQRQV